MAYSPAEIENTHGWRLRQRSVKAGPPGDAGRAPVRSDAPADSRRVRGFLQRAEAGEFVQEHKMPKRRNKEGVAGWRISLPHCHRESRNKSPFPTRPRPTGLPPSSAPHSPTLWSSQLVPWAR
jgi:hypothetical protein